jgi:hypothetical protein
MESKGLLQPPDLLRIFPQDVHPELDIRLGQKARYFSRVQALHNMGIFAVKKTDHLVIIH